MLLLRLLQVRRQLLLRWQLLLRRTSESRRCLEARRATLNDGLLRLLHRLSQLLWLLLEASSLQMRRHLLRHLSLLLLLRWLHHRHHFAENRFAWQRRSGRITAILLRVQRLRLLCFFFFLRGEAA